VVKPSPAAQGYTLHSCHCGDSYKDNYVAALDVSTPKVIITADAATGKPALSWANGSEGVTYEIHRATSKSGKYTRVATVAEPGWIDTSVSVGKTY
jgi:lactocepin